MDQAGKHLRTLVSAPTAVGLASRLAVERLEREKIDPRKLLRTAGIPVDALSSGKRIRVDSQIAFLDLAGYALADEWIGLTLAAEFDLRELGLLYYVAASSERLGEALTRLERYIRLGNEALTVKVRKGVNCKVGLSYSGVSRHPDRHQMEWFALSILRLCRLLLGQKVMPASTRFMHHRSGDLREARRFFGDGVEFEAEADELCFDAALLDVALVNADPFLNELMVKSCDEAIAGRLSTGNDLRTRVENAIAPLLPHREANASAIARRLGMSERTLSRRLKAEGLTFAAILDDLRRELAVHYLANSTPPISQIAWLLGLSGPSALSHACRRWTGKTPRAYRRARFANAASTA